MCAEDLWTEVHLSAVMLVLLGARIAHATFFLLSKRAADWTDRALHTLDAYKAATYEGQNCAPTCAWPQGLFFFFWPFPSYQGFVAA